MRADRTRPADHLSARLEGAPQMATKDEQDRAKAEREAKEREQAQKDRQATAEVAKGTAVGAAQPRPTGDDQRSAADIDRDRRIGRAAGTTTPELAEELDRLDVNAALDNRTGDQRPQREEFPAVPQQVDGPEVGHFAEHAERTRAAADKFAKPSDQPLGMKAEGPHGLGPVDAKVEGPDDLDAKE